MTRGRVLYLCGQAPWDGLAGSAHRDYWMIDALAKHYAVDLVVGDESVPMPPDVAALVDDYASFPRTRSSNEALHEYVANRLGRYPYAAIAADLPMLAALPRRDAIPIVYNAHRCESAALARAARIERPHIATRLALAALHMRRREATLIARAAVVTAPSDADVAEFARFCPGVRAKSAIVRNGVDVARYAALRDVAPEPHTVLLADGLDIRGIRWFLQRGLPRLRAKVPDAVVRVAGRREPYLLAELQRYENIEPVSDALPLEAHLRAATVVAAPTAVGSHGDALVLEAWAAGRPVVTTSAGASAIEVLPHCELLVCDEPAAFADAIVELFESPALRASLVAITGDAIAAYDWRGISADVLRAYERIALETPPVHRISTVSGEDVVLAGRS